MEKDFGKGEWALLCLAYQHLSSPIGLLEFGIEQIHNLELS